MVFLDGRPNEILESPLVTWISGHFSFTYLVTAAKFVKASGFVPTLNTSGSMWIFEGAILYRDLIVVAQQRNDFPVCTSDRRKYCVDLVAF